MKNILLSFLIALFFGSGLFSQGNFMLSPQDKAYLFHTVRKSPILEQNIGRYIKYTGKEITLPNGEINYDSIELVIVNQPELLTIYANEIRKAPKGILAEVANKMALWHLNKVLVAYRQNELEKEGFVNDYHEFEIILFSELPECALKTKKEQRIIHPKVEQLNNPSLTFNDKVAALDGFGAWTEQEKKQTLDAYNIAINKWVAERTLGIYKKLGGEADVFHNVLTAAGDGSSTSGLFEEREKDERGRWNKGLPKAVGLFPYESYIGIKKDAKRKNPEVLPMGHTAHLFQTVGDGKKTNIHVDVWGYNSEKQTTVVIDKKGKIYPLFGSTDTRFLSPDSTFGEGDTYYTMINRLRSDIAMLEEMVSGKKGIDHWIEYHEDSKQDKLLEIDKTEKELNDIRYSTIITNNKKYTTDSKRTKRKKRQEKVVLYYEQLAAIKRKIRELKEEKEIILTKKQALNRQLQGMYDLIGTKWVSFEENDGLFIFEDSARFDLLTQEFTFPASDEKEDFEIRLLAIPYSHTSDQYDEVMLHINVVDAVPHYNAQVQLNLNDVFEVDQYELNQKLFAASDSIPIMELFEALQDNKPYFDIIARGAGIGKWKNFEPVKFYDPVELDNYPGDSQEERNDAKIDSVFKRLRTTQVKVLIDRCITLEVNSFTDPVKSNFTPPSDDLKEMMQQYNLSENDMLSAYRTYVTLKTLKQELNVLAGKYLDRPEAKTVIDRINKSIDKSRISVGKTSFKFEDFEE
jgi:hypothetical protein